jgi:hypothetical protein
MISLTQKELHCTGVLSVRSVQVVAFLLLGAGALAQTTTTIPVLTVCEALSGLAQYNGKIIIVVGREAYSDEGSWLGQECGGVVVTEGFKWADVIWTSYIRNQVDPAPELTAGFQWEENALRKKLATVRKTTRLRRYRGKLSLYNDRWMVIFGRLETRMPLPVVTYPNGSRRGIGFGHLGDAPAQLVFCKDCTRELKPK